MDGHDDTSDRSISTTRRRVLAAAGAVGVGLLAGCSGGSDGGDASGDDSAGSGGDANDGADGESGGEPTDAEESAGGSAASWQTTEVTDVLTEERFSIGGLEGPVVVQSFAVWCPKCQRQSEELSEVGESATVVSLNTDPNEDAEKVRQHAERNGFDWRFAVAPTEMTKSLVDEFGTTVTNAPSTPIVVACDDGAAEFFSGSQQSAEQIRSAAAEC
jgi:thiol-disulfide isomerase/thioredoxin